MLNVVNECGFVEVIRNFDTGLIPPNILPPNIIIVGVFYFSALKP
jgi:hypothetical protein